MYIYIHNISLYINCRSFKGLPFTLQKPVWISADCCPSSRQPHGQQSIEQLRQSEIASQNVNLRVFEPPLHSTQENSAGESWFGTAQLTATKQRASAATHQGSVISAAECGNPESDLPASGMLESKKWMFNAMNRDLQHH